VRRSSEPTETSRFVSTLDFGVTVARLVDAATGRTRRKMKRRTVSSSSGSLERYIAEIHRYPILTLAEEQALARTCRAALVTANLRFVVKIAYEYRSYGFRLADLVQEGNIGLMRAVQKFDPDRGIRLISYASWWVRAYIQNHILRWHSLVKLGTTQAQRRLFFSLNRTKRELDKTSVEHGVDSDGEDSSKIALKLKVKAGEVDEMTMRLSARDLSLDAQPPDGDYSPADLLADEGPSQDHELSEAEEQLLVRSRIGAALARLDWRERYLIEQRLMSDDPPTLKEVGDHFGISRERTRQLEMRAKRKLKEELHALASEIDWPVHERAVGVEPRASA
jgi:RNA polymerase sigma-32 factor